MSKKIVTASPEFQHAEREQLIQNIEHTNEEFDRLLRGYTGDRDASVGDVVKEVRAIRSKLRKLNEQLQSNYANSTALPIVSKADPVDEEDPDAQPGLPIGHGTPPHSDPVAPADPVDVPVTPIAPIPEPAKVFTEEAESQRPKTEEVSEDANTRLVEEIWNKR